MQLDLAAMKKLTSSILVPRSFDSHVFVFSLPVPSLCSFDRFWFLELPRPFGMDGYVLGP